MGDVRTLVQVVFLQKAADFQGDIAAFYGGYDGIVLYL